MQLNLPKLRDPKVFNAIREFVTQALGSNTLEKLDGERSTVIQRTDDDKIELVHREIIGSEQELRGENGLDTTFNIVTKLNPKDHMMRFIANLSQGREDPEVRYTVEGDSDSLGLMSSSGSTFDKKHILKHVNRLGLTSLASKIQDACTKLLSQ